MQSVIAFCGFDRIITEYHLQSKCAQNIIYNPNILIFQRMVKSHDKIKLGYGRRTTVYVVAT